MHNEDSVHIDYCSGSADLVSKGKKLMEGHLSGQIKLEKKVSVTKLTQQVSRHQGHSSKFHDLYTKLGRNKQALLQVGLKNKQLVLVEKHM